MELGETQNHRMIFTVVLVFFLTLLAQSGAFTVLGKVRKLTSNPGIESEVDQR